MFYKKIMIVLCFAFSIVCVSTPNGDINTKKMVERIIKILNNDDSVESVKKSLAVLFTKVPDFTHLYSLKQHESPLFSLIEQNVHASAVKEFLDRGVHPDIQDEASSETALIKALRNSRFDIAEALLDNSANVTLADATGSTPLIYAVENADVPLSVIQKLLERGSSPSWEKKANGQSAVEIAEGHENEAVKTLMMQARSKEGQDLIVQAITQGDVKKMRQLLPTMVVRSNSNARIVFDIIDALVAATNNTAKKKEILDILQLLLKRGLQVNVPNNSGDTPLMYAVAKQEKGAAIFIADHTRDINHANHRGKTALSIAQSQNNTEMINFLKGRGAHEEQTKSSEAFLALEDALVKKDVLRVKKLVQTNNYSSNQLGTLLIDLINKDIPAKSRSSVKDMIQLLIDVRARLDMQDDMGNTPLFVSTSRGLEDIAVLLVKHSANPLIKNKEGMNALYEAIRLSRGNVIKAIFTHNPNMDFKDKNGRTPLEYAISIKKGDDIVTMLRGLTEKHPAFQKQAYRFVEHKQPYQARSLPVLNDDGVQNSTHALQLFLDETETDKVTTGAVKILFLISLQQKAAPILVSRAVYNKTFFNKYLFNELIKTKGYEKEIAYYNAIRSILTGYSKDKDIIKQQLVALYDSVKPLNLDSKFQTAVVLAEHPFDPAEWKVYAVTSKAMLMVPRWMYDQYEKQAVMHNVSIDLVAGLQLSSFKLIDDQLSYFQKARDPKNSDPLESPRSSYDDALTSDRSGNTGDCSPDLSCYLNSTLLTGLFVPKTAYAQQKKLAPRWTVYAMGHGSMDTYSILSMKLSQFREMLGFFNDKVVTTLFIYNSCFAAGTKEQLLYGSLREPTKGLTYYNYAIVSEALTDAIVQNNHGYPVVLGYTSTGTIPDDSIDWNRKRLRVYYNNVYHFNEFFKDVATADALDYVKILPLIINTWTQSNFGLIRYPGTEWFSVLDVNNEVAQVTDTFVAAHDPKAPVDVVSFFKKRNLRALLLYARYIPLTLSLDTMVELIPMKADTYYIQTLKIKTTFNEFLQMLAFLAKERNRIFSAHHMDALMVSVDTLITRDKMVKNIIIGSYTDSPLTIYYEEDQKHMTVKFSQGSFNVHDGQEDEVREYKRQLESRESRIVAAKNAYEKRSEEYEKIRTKLSSQ